MENIQFDIPVVLFTFKRSDTVVKILEVLALVKPKRMYILSDGPRNDSERAIIEEVRNEIEKYITWDCEVIRNYAQNNRGVYRNIALGAKWVFEQEKYAIFLEDDNLPEFTFFKFCKEMLERYEDDKRILWVCGTNYLENYTAYDGASYVFTKHLMPCGWASWNDKFLEMYDFNLEIMNSENLISQLKYTYTNNSLYLQQIKSARYEKFNFEKFGQYASWDYHMAISIRANSVLGICPAKNQIKNIGVDEFSIHGGTSYSNVMTKRFCGIESYPLEDRIVHPANVIQDINFEKAVDSIILWPLKVRLKDQLGAIVKSALGLNRFEKIRDRNRSKKGE